MSLFITMIIDFWAALLLLAVIYSPQGLIAESSFGWDVTAITLAVFAGSGPAIVAALASWIKARAAHGLARRTRDSMAKLYALAKANQKTLADREATWQMLKRYLDGREKDEREEP